eukprot:gnl/MRDRNA2_/MRDRNA2_82856_c0_seq3.p1 gnl/MRDRNA2_/MRDRNA2_82856_c0~~gnl/MRDRNA2_/MRDRNA2_82856_c0_seq3.p1  ORF type:complete len:160 (+),score=19.14 gnl/MRDRNA2_/MRDRNA2_82856_c0_seq3:120-599(+)
MAFMLHTVATEPAPENSGKHIGTLELVGAYGPLCNCCRPYQFKPACGVVVGACCGCGPKGPEWTAVKPGFQKFLDEVDGLVKNAPQESGCCGPHGDTCRQALETSWLSSANQHLQTHGMVCDLVVKFVEQGEAGGKRVCMLRVYMLKGDMVGEPVQQRM